MTLKRTVALVVGSLVVSATIALVANNLLSDPPSCEGLLSERANEADEKVIMNNRDGGLYLMTRGPEQRQVLFFGYLGPVSAEQLRGEMVDAGLTKVKIETEGTCVSEGGVKYTVVVGSYVPAPQPDPI